MFEPRVPPQEFLDQLHKMEFPRMFDPSLSKEQRRNLINLNKKRLGEWQKELNETIQRIKASTESPDKARVALAPYNALGRVANNLKKSTIELDKALRADRALPRGVEFGTTIFGNPETGEYRLGSYEDAQLFEDLIRVEGRLNLVVRDLRPIQRDGKLAIARAKQAKQDVDFAQAQLKRTRSPIVMGVQLGIVAITMVICLYSGWVIFNAEVRVADELSNPALGGLLLIVAVAAAVLMVVIWRRRTRSIDELRLKIRQAHEDFIAAKAEATEQRRELVMNTGLYEQLMKEYKELRSIFPKAE